MDLVILSALSLVLVKGSCRLQNWLCIQRGMLAPVAMVIHIAQSNIGWRCWPKRHACSPCIYCVDGKDLCRCTWDGERWWAWKRLCLVVEFCQYPSVPAAVHSTRLLSASPSWRGYTDPPAEMNAWSSSWGCLLQYLAVNEETCLKALFRMENARARYHEKPGLSAVSSYCRRMRRSPPDCDDCSQRTSGGSADDRQAPSCEDKRRCACTASCCCVSVASTIPYSD